MLLIAAFSRYAAALDWTRQKILAEFGPLESESDPFDFSQTDYYEASMGGGLQKMFFACAASFDPALLADVKLQANAWEQEYAAGAGQAELRPLNVDPGYVTEAKLVLASTKDHAHRIYLRDGVYAEVTLYFQRGQWRNSPWTYPDYQLPACQEFFSACRECVKMRRKASG